MIGVVVHAFKYISNGTNKYYFPHEHSVYYVYTYGFNDKEEVT